jgi:hypothetical protein
MPEIKFALGEIVRAKGIGGPDLTVIRVKGERVTVAWRLRRKRQRHTFPSVCLERKAVAHAGD